ncbi:proline-rich proteoglycan 2-like [Gouania willdenowi]|uniref:proline-rich proteoglycan 2-like n=1 Tax=Gouania willdenowi TaxID=441366 RepID=UPI0010562248|nr:proline-rich proteoglycan 2-like [Gouania willdenowi]
MIQGALGHFPRPSSPPRQPRDPRLRGSNCPYIHTRESSKVLRTRRTPPSQQPPPQGTPSEIPAEEQRHCAGQSPSERLPESGPRVSRDQIPGQREPVQRQHWQHPRGDHLPLHPQTSKGRPPAAASADIQGHGQRCPPRKTPAKTGPASPPNLPASEGTPLGPGIPKNEHPGKSPLGGLPSSSE